MSMIETGGFFDDASLALLRSLRGKRLYSYEAYAPFDPDEHLYKTIRLHFDDGDIDLINEHVRIPLGPEFEEEHVAMLRVEEARGDIWCPDGRDLYCGLLDVYVADVLVVMDTALLSKGSHQLNRLRMVQAVAFEDESGQLVCIDRDIWSDEYLSVRRGTKISEVTRDFRPDFVVEPPYSYKFGRSIMRVSNPKQ